MYSGMQDMVIKGAILESITCKYSLKLLTGLHLNTFHAKGDYKQYYGYCTPPFALVLKKTTKLKQLNNTSNETRKLIDNDFRKSKSFSENYIPSTTSLQESTTIMKKRNNNETL